MKSELNSILGTNLVIDNSFNGEANSAVKALQTKFNKEIGTNLEENGELNKETLYQLEMYLLDNPMNSPASVDYTTANGYGQVYDMYGNAGPGESVSDIDEKIAELIAGIDNKYKDVATAQAYLRLMKFDLGNYGPNKNGVDGLYGDITRSAIKAFQKYKKLDVNGTVDDTLLEKLKETVKNGLTIHDIVNVAFLWPTETYLITSGFGYRINPITNEPEGHNGIDISPKKYRVEGDPIMASLGGVVEYAGWDTHGGGNMIRIRTEIDGVIYHTRYFHLQDGSIQVQIGDEINASQLIAKMGSTGRSTGTHLHFQINVDNIPENPFDFAFYKE